MTLSECREKIIPPESAVLLVLQSPEGTWRPRRIAEVERVTLDTDLIQILDSKKDRVVFAQPYWSFEEAAKAATIMNKFFVSQKEFLAS